MKHLLLFPPAWQPTAPPLGIPSLIAQLKQEGFSAEALDLNIEFYNDILKKSYLEKAVKNAKEILLANSIEAKKYDIKRIEDYPIEIQALLLKDKEISEYIETNSELLNAIPKLAEKALSSIKNPKKFYEPDSYLKSLKIVELALDIASLPYAPAKVSIYSFDNPLLRYDYENIKYNVFSTSMNIFIDYYEKWLPVIQKKKPQYIGISINSDSQVLPGLTLANLLKTHTNAHINIGGNYFSRVVDSVVTYPEFFDIFADSILVDEGERPIVELAKYIDNRISIDEVPNLIYKKDNEVIVNKKCKPINLSELPIPDFDNFNFSKYIAPEIALPIETTRGCYWGKCTFCDIPYGKEYSEKDVDELINELKVYKKKYGITKFNIIDESVHPIYLEKMAEKIIENKLNINYCAYLRTEQSFSKEILEKAKKSGLRMALWGIEFGSERALKLSNKGVDVANRFKILEEATNAGIWNHALIIFGLPTETLDEAKETVEMLYTNSGIVNSSTIAPFTLSKHSKITKNPEKYGVKIISGKEDDFYTGLKYESNGMSTQEMDSVMQLHIENNKKIYDVSLWLSLNRIYIFLYLSRFGLAWLKNYKVNNSKTGK